MNCLTTTVINSGHSSIFEANCLDRCSGADCFWTSDSRKRLCREEEKEDRDDLLNTVPGASTRIMLWGEYDSALVKYSVRLAIGLHFVGLCCSLSSLLVQFRSCLNLIWAHISFSDVLTILFWDWEISASFSQNCSTLEIVSSKVRTLVIYDRK